MTTHHESPERLVNFENARARHGERADRMAAMLTMGDPLADAAIAELDTNGKPARKALAQGLTDGLKTVDDPPPAVEALLRQLESMPAWVSEEALAAGDRTSLMVPPLWAGLAFTSGSLAHTYSSPSIAKLLVQTGQLATMAPRRLAETGTWKAASMLPGGLLRGRPGYVQTAQVRLLHARVRASALKHGWQTDEWGVPINQTDIARTWIDFTFVPFTLLARAGFAFSEEEQHGLYQHWWYIAHLVGLDEDLYLDVTDHESATELLDLLDSTIEPPDDNSRALVRALFDATVENLSGQPGSPLTATGARELLHASARLFHGDTRAEALGIPESTATPLLPVLAMGNAQLRRNQLMFPEVAARDCETNAEESAAVLDALPGHTAYQANVATDANA